MKLAPINPPAADIERAGKNGPGDFSDGKNQPTPPLPKGRRIFAISREVRDKIYAHLLTAPEYIPIRRAWTKVCSWYDGDLDLAILRVSKQAAAESTRVLYSTNTFLYLSHDNGQPLNGMTSPADLARQPAHPAATAPST